MHNLIIFDKTETEKAVERGETLALFVVGPNGKPLRKISAVNYTATQTTKQHNKYVEKAVEYIEENYYKDIRLEDLARSCDVSSSHLSRLFSAATGTTVTGYILSVRMNRAAYMLVNTDESVVNIAREVGYPDCGYFHKHFRSFFGVTPLAYRNSITLI